MKRYQFSENNKKAGTKAVILTDAGFKMNDFHCFYISGSNDLYYMTEQRLKRRIRTGYIKLLN